MCIVVVQMKPAGAYINRPYSGRGLAKAQRL